MSIESSIFGAPSHLVAGVIALLKDARMPWFGHNATGDVYLLPRLRRVVPQGDPSLTVRWGFLDPLI